jgi:hypothetical protein
VRGGISNDGTGAIDTTGAQPPQTTGGPGSASESLSTAKAGCALAGASSLAGTPLLLSALLGLLVTALLSARRRATRGNR